MQCKTQNLTAKLNYKLKKKLYPAWTWQEPHANDATCSGKAKYAGNLHLYTSDNFKCTFKFFIINFVYASKIQNQMSNDKLIETSGITILFKGMSKGLILTKEHPIISCVPYNANHICHICSICPLNEKKHTISSTSGSLLNKYDSTITILMFTLY